MMQDRTGARWTLLRSENMTILEEMEDNFVDAIVTDPPYGIQILGSKWDYQVPSVGFWQQCLRVLKPGGYLASFAGARTQHRAVTNIEDAGFEIRDVIMWVFTSGLPKGLDIAKGLSKEGNPLSEDYNGYNTCLKPAFEPIVLARKPFVDTVVDNVAKWGTGGLNTGACRVKTPDSWVRAAVGARRGEWQKSRKRIEQESHDEGRFPPNVILDGSEEVNNLFPQSGKGSASRLFYAAKASPSERNVGVSNPNTHPTVKPISLMRYICKLVSPPGEALILDPFAGSGTTGIACCLEQKRFIGIEMSEDYYDIASERIEYFSQQHTQE